MTILEWEILRSRYLEHMACYKCGELVPIQNGADAFNAHMLRHIEAGE